MNEDIKRFRVLTEGRDRETSRFVEESLVLTRLALQTQLL